MSNILYFFVIFVCQSHCFSVVFSCCCTTAIAASVEANPTRKTFIVMTARDGAESSEMPELNGESFMYSMIKYSMACVTLSVSSFCC